MVGFYRLENLYLKRLYIMLKITQPVGAERI
jgi:hypothetical protein